MSTLKLLNSAGITAAIGLASLPAFLTLTPLVAPNGVFADDPATANANAPSLTSLTIYPALAITAENITVSATPTVGNTFVTATSTVNVKNTGSSGGYHLIMSSENGGSLRSDGHSIDTISGYSKTGEEMRNLNASSWGWTLQSVGGTNATPAENNGGDILNTYYPIPTSSTNWNLAADQATNKYAYLKNTTDYTNTTSGDNVVVGFGFAINASTAAGTYTDTITYTAIPNKDNRTIFDMTNMQDLYTYNSACYNTPTPAVRTGDTPDTAVTESMTSLTGYSVGQTGTDKIPTKVLKDTRDGNEYTIKKLADGHCWMTESLAIEGQTLKPDKSNVVVDFVLPDAVVANSIPNSTDTAYVTAEGLNNSYLYNWYAATAGTGTDDMISTEATAVSAVSDICPKGWQLPNGKGDMSWDKLLRVGQGVYEVAMGNNAFTSTKVNWGSYADFKDKDNNLLGLQLTAGFHSNSGILWKTDGCYWSRTAYITDVSAYNLYYTSGGIYPLNNGDRRSGRAVRCVSQ